MSNRHHEDVSQTLFRDAQAISIFRLFFRRPLVLRHYAELMLHAKYSGLLECYVQLSGFSVRVLQVAITMHKGGCAAPARRSAEPACIRLPRAGSEQTGVSISRQISRNVSRSFHRGFRGPGFLLPAGHVVIWHAAQCDGETLKLSPTFAPLAHHRQPLSSKYTKLRFAKT
jgi:hypothetical protein